MIECECSQTSHIILCLSCTVFGTNSNSSVQIQITTRFHISHNSLSVLHSVRYKFKFLGTNSNSSVQIQITTRFHISHNPLSVLHSLRRKFKFSVQIQIPRYNFKLQPDFIPQWTHYHEASPIVFAQKLSDF